MNASRRAPQNQPRGSHARRAAISDSPSRQHSFQRRTRESCESGGVLLCLLQSGRGLTQPGPMGIARVQVAAAIISGSRLHSQPRASQFMERQVDPLMVPIKTTKNIIRPADPREDSCGGRVQPPPGSHTHTRVGVVVFLDGAFHFPREKRSSLLTLFPFISAFLASWDTFFFFHALQKVAEEVAPEHRSALSLFYLL